MNILSNNSTTAGSLGQILGGIFEALNDGPEAPSWSDADGIDDSGSWLGSDDSGGDILDLSPNVVDSLGCGTSLGCHRNDEDDDAACMPPGKPVNIIILDLDIINNIYVGAGDDSDTECAPTCDGDWDAPGDLWAGADCRGDQPGVRIRSLKSLLERAEALEERGLALRDKAGALDQVGQDLENGQTPTTMKNRARMALKLGKVRVRQLGIRAGRLEAQAEALEERGDPCSLRKAEKLRERAAELRTAASDLKEKVKTEAKDLWDRGIRMAKALKCLGITGDDPDTEENELKLAGTQLRAIAERLSEIAEVCLDKAERLRALWEKLSEHGHGRRWLHLDDVI